MKVLILNGWSAPESIWGDFIHALQEHLSSANHASLSSQSHKWGPKVEIVNIDCLRSLEEWNQFLNSMVDEQTLLIGWSLGGELASYLIAEKGLRVRSFVSLMANPSFIKSSACGWAMSKAEFDGFESKLRDNPKDAMRVFCALLAQGEPQKKSVLMRLRTEYQTRPISDDVLLQSLSLLASINIDKPWGKIPVPALFVWAEQDALSGCPSADEIARMKSSCPKQDFECLPHAGHLPMYGAANQLSGLVAQFALKCGGLNE